MVGGTAGALGALGSGDRPWIAATVTDWAPLPDPPRGAMAAPPPGRLAGFHGAETPDAFEPVELARLRTTTDGPRDFAGVARPGSWTDAPPPPPPAGRLRGTIAIDSVSVTGAPARPGEAAAHGRPSAGRPSGHYPPHLHARLLKLGGHRGGAEGRRGQADGRERRTGTRCARAADRKASSRWRSAVKLGRSHFMVWSSRGRADEARDHQCRSIVFRFVVAHSAAGMIATAWKWLAGDRISTFQRWVSFIVKSRRRSQEPSCRLAHFFSQLRMAGRRTERRRRVALRRGPRDQGPRNDHGSHEFHGFNANHYDHSNP